MEIDVGIRGEFLITREMGILASLEDLASLEKAVRIYASKIGIPMMMSTDETADGVLIKWFPESWKEGS